MKDQSCGECFFYLRTKELNQGECRRYPPQATFMPQQTPMGVAMAKFTGYPQVQLADVGCGEFKRKGGTDYDAQTST